MLDAKKLRMLAELDRLGTIGEVAAELNLAPPGVSMQLAALERDAGLALTQRIGRGVVLTPAGKVLAAHGRDIVALLTIAEMEIAALKEGSAGSYRVAAFPTAARTFVASAWRALLQHPETGVHMTLLEKEPQDALAALEAGEIDMAVAHSYSNMAPVSARGLVVRRILDEPVRLAVPREGHLGDTVALAEFAAQPWILPPGRTTCHEMVQRACAAAGFTPRPAAEASDFSVQLELVDAGVGVALIPSLGSPRVPSGVRLLELAHPVRRYGFLVTRQASAADAGLARLGQFLADAASSLLPPGSA